MRLLVIVWLALASAHASADTIAMLPLDGEKRLELLGQPVAAEIARALKAAGLDVVVVGATMEVPDRANLIVDGTIKAAKSKQIELSIRIRDPRDGTVLETLPGAPTKLDNLDKAAADLSARVVPLVKQHLTDLSRPAVETRSAEPKPVLPVQPAAPAKPTLSAAVALAAVPTLMPLRNALEREIATWAASQQIQARVALEVLGYSVQPGKVPMARARVRVLIDNYGDRTFNRVVRTDTIVGDRDSTPDELAARAAREVLAIVEPQLVARGDYAVTMRALLVLALVAGVAHAQPSSEPSTDPAVALREANAAATAGDWARVSATVQPLLAGQLERADLAEAHRLAGIAAMFEQPPNYAAADEHFLAYLRIDLDAHLDPALYPPEVVNRFNDVRARHATELKALRPQVRKRYAVLAVLPPFAQFQNGEKAKGIVIGSLLGAFAITNVTTYFVLRSWCFKQAGPVGSSIGCDGRNEPTTNHNSAATTLRALNIAAGVGLIATYVYGVYDGVRGYRRDTRERSLVPYASSSNDGAVIGVHLKF